MEKTTKKIVVKSIDPKDAYLLGLIFQIEGGPLRNRLIKRLTPNGKKHYEECLSYCQYENV